MHKEKLEQGQNSGLIAPFIRPQDFIAGGESAISFAPRLASGNWRPFVSTHERQSTSKYDTMSCVTFSALNSVETQLNFLKATGQIPDATLRACEVYGYFNPDGTFNFSDWFTAIMSGTTKAGNTLQAAWDSIRNHGLLPAGNGKFPEDFDNIEGWLDPSSITSTKKDNAKLFLELFSVGYEWVLLGEANQRIVTDHLKHAPLHTATPTCGSWNSPEGEIVHHCGDYKRLNHATTLIGMEENVAYLDLDTYNPFIKRLAWDYHVPFALKGVVTVKPVVVAPVKPKLQVSLNLQRGSRGQEVIDLQNVLIFEGFLKSGFNTGYFGDMTFQAVILFQEAHASDILTPVGLTRGTGIVGNSTRAYINRVYA